MHYFIKKFKREYAIYFQPDIIKMIKKCLIISCLTCLFGVLLLSFYNTYYISINIYKASLIIFRTGLMIGLFPVAFILIIGKWKNNH